MRGNANWCDAEQDDRSVGVRQLIYLRPDARAHLATFAQKAIERVRARAQVNYRGHDLRRTAASLMVGSGTSRLVVSKILNHVEQGVTAVYDRHSYDAEKRVALEAWSRRVAMMLDKVEPTSNVLAFQR